MTSQGATLHQSTLVVMSIAISGVIANLDHVSPNELKKVRGQRNEKRENGNKYTSLYDLNKKWTVAVSQDSQCTLFWYTSTLVTVIFYHDLMITTFLSFHVKKAIVASGSERYKTEEKICIDMQNIIVHFSNDSKWAITNKENDLQCMVEPIGVTNLINTIFQDQLIVDETSDQTQVITETLEFSDISTVHEYPLSFEWVVYNCSKEEIYFMPISYCDEVCDKEHIPEVERGINNSPMTVKIKFKFFWRQAVQEFFFSMSAQERSNCFDFITAQGLLDSWIQFERNIPKLISGFCLFLTLASSEHFHSDSPMQDLLLQIYSRILEQISSSNVGEQSFWDGFQTERNEHLTIRVKRAFSDEKRGKAGAVKVEQYAITLEHNVDDSVIKEEFGIEVEQIIEMKNGVGGERPDDPDRDGSIYDMTRDPPGQYTVYVAPGDEKRESYRLSTFRQFPPNIPVTKRDLAASGFYFTGYKDRVKCFSCGLCVENWVVGDDVRDRRWHRSNCDFVNRRECGNIPIGRIFSQFLNHPETNITGVTKSHGPARPQQAVTQAYELMEVSAPPMLEGNLNVASTNSTTFVSSQLCYNRDNFKYADMPSYEHSNFVKHLDLKEEKNRRLTFRNWPEGERTVSIKELAKSGFFYLGNLDRVQCFSCAGVLRNWALGDIVENEHRRHFGHCRMLRGAEMMNVPIVNEERAAAVEAVQEPADPIPSLTEGLREMFPCIDPVSPHMRDEARRLETFDQRWPNRIAATPAQIAKAGFFFLGERDRVKCWYCNGGLQNWDTDDEPWTEHAKWFPTCEFILQRKGPEFVHRVVARFPNLRRPVIHRPYDIPPNEELPPLIIDPQADERRLNEKVEAAMRAQVAQSVIGMGVSEIDIKRVLRRKIKNSGVEFGSEDELLGALENQEYSDDEESSTGSSGVNISNATVHNVNERRLQNSNETLEMSSSEATALKQISSASLATTPMDIEQSENVSSSPSNKENLRQRLRQLEEERICKVCLDKSADMVFIPCGHLCCCYNCGSTLRKCPVCRKKIEKVLRTYMS